MTTTYILLKSRAINDKPIEVKRSESRKELEQLIEDSIDGNTHFWLGRLDKKRLLEVDIAALDGRPFLYCEKLTPKKFVLSE